MTSSMPWLRRPVPSAYVQRYLSLGPFVAFLVQSVIHSSGGQHRKIFGGRSPYLGRKDLFLLPMLWHYYAQIQLLRAISINRPIYNYYSFEGIARRPDSLALSAHLSVGDMPS